MINKLLTFKNKSNFMKLNNFKTIIMRIYSNCYKILNKFKINKKIMNTVKLLIFYNNNIINMHKIHIINNKKLIIIKN